MQLFSIEFVFNNYLIYINAVVVSHNPKLENTFTKFTLKLSILP